jgi:hypothetical protein
VVDEVDIIMVRVDGREVLEEDDKEETGEE